jgi:hypothetical protein
MTGTLIMSRSLVSVRTAHRTGRGQGMDVWKKQNGRWVIAVLETGAGRASDLSAA